MIEKISGTSNVMQNISNVPEDARAKMEFKDELTDEFDDMKDELVKDEFDSEDRISIKSPIGKDAFDIVDEFIGDTEGPVKVNGTDQNSEFGLADDDPEEGHEANNGDLNPLDTGESCDDQSDIVEEICDDEDDVDPLMNESENATAFDLKPGKRKNFDGSDENTSVRKSSRLRSKAESREEAEPEKPKEKQKMLQRPTERPTQVEDGDDENDNSDSEAAEETTDGVKEEEEQLGDPTRAPGDDVVGLIDSDFLLPFQHGWVRECVYREMKSGPPMLDIVYYHPPKTQQDFGPKNREARRKRKSKHDQERYFEDFPHDILSVTNFSYVKRELGLNNEAYEKITEVDGGPDGRGEPRRSARQVASYKEVAEHEGLLESEHSSAESSDEVVEEVTDFDFGLPLTLQLQSRVTPLREEHRRRRKYPDRKRCITPPRAADIPWTQLDDDPLGLWTELHEECLRSREKAPPTPPPLRAVRLNQPRTVEMISEKLSKVKEGLADPLKRIVAANKDLVGSDNLSSHDLAVRKYKHFSSASHRNQMRPGMMGAKKAPPQMLNRNNMSGSRPGQLGTSQGFVKVRLPMQSTNGKRPVVELVMLTNGKYQPIKFTNNRQVTEAIPKRLFDQANSLRKTLYQRSVQVPKIGTKQVFLAINPTPGGVTPYTTSPHTQPPKAKPGAEKPSGQTEQVSILVRPSGGGNAVLLNVPRNVALKVKVGTTLSFSASTDQKYTVIDNKLHPPVGKHKPAQPAQSSQSKTQSQSQSQSQTKTRMPHLPSGVSIRPVTPGSRQSPVTAGRPVAKSSHAPARSSHAPAKSSHAPPPPALSPDLSNFTPCSPFCPGVSGIPELECTQCHSLFHPKCVSIPQWKVATIQNSFKCKRCSCSSNKRTEVIDID